jgi:hypothetical protein
MITRRAFLTDPVQVLREDRILDATWIRRFNHQPSDSQRDKESTEEQSCVRNVTAQNIELRAAVASLRRRSRNEQG